MIRRDISDFNVEGKKERYAVKEVRNFIDSDKALDGNILILYGLRRTGKTTIMEQALSGYQDKNLCAFYEVQENDTMVDIEETLFDASKQGIKVICFDEITKADDFITNSASLADVFAKKDMRIIVTGTDSLSFVLATNHELYGRAYEINTTYIPFAEHAEVLDTNDMDDYIQFGGLMCKGKDIGDKFIYDYNSALKYLDSAVSENIVNSLKKNNGDSYLEELSKKELQTIIEKLVEIYSGSFNKKSIQNKLTKVSVNYPIKFLANLIDDDLIRPITSNNREIAKDFAETINADTEIKTQINAEMITELKNYLTDLNLVSVTSTVKFRYNEEGWNSEKPEYEYYIIQPAIKFNHLLKGKDFFKNAPYYNKLSNLEKDFLETKLEEKIFGDMLEQIVLFDTSKALNVNLVRFDKKKYEVYKPSFIVNNQKKGEFDMLIYDTNRYKYWGFEIKHTTMPFIAQEKHLQDEAFFPILEHNFGHRENVCVLYRGEPFLSADSDTIYLNVTDFLCSINRTHDVEKTILELTQNLSSREIPREEVYDPRQAEIKQQRNINFEEVYNLYRKEENMISNKAPIEFMKEIVKIHGADFNVINEAIEAVTKVEYETTEFSVKLLQDIRNTEEYKNASVAEKSKPKDYTM